MRVVSVNVAMAKEVEFGKVRVKTSIVKNPVAGKVKLSFDGLTGDGMAQAVYDGHRRPALYSYDLAHYQFWQKELNHSEYPMGKFGENITTEGLVESDVFAGDIFTIGTCKVQAIGFRIPCRNLALTMDDNRMVIRFRNAGKPGIFFSVLEEGEIQAGDEILFSDRVDEDFSIKEMDELYYGDSPAKEKLELLLSKPFIPGTVKKDFEKLHKKITTATG